MKKTLVLTLSAFIMTTTVFADSINLGDFPIGSWLDENYNAVWEFTSGNIRIVSPDGKAYCDFAEKTVNNFQVGVSDSGQTITFASHDTDRSYKFTKAMTSMDITLEIDRPNKPQYSVVMKKQ